MCLWTDIALSQFEAAQCGFNHFKAVCGTCCNCGRPSHERSCITTKERT